MNKRIKNIIAVHLLVIIICANPPSLIGGTQQTGDEFSEKKEDKTKIQNLEEIRWLQAEAAVYLATTTTKSSFNHNVLVKYKGDIKGILDKAQLTQYTEKIFADRLEKAKKDIPSISMNFTVSIVVADLMSPVAYHIKCHCRTEKHEKGIYLSFLGLEPRILVPTSARKQISVMMEKYLGQIIEDESFTDIVNDYDYDMVFVPGGSYDMGGTTDRFSNENEGPVHEVFVDAFYIKRFEVTQEEWKDVMGDNPSYFAGCDDCPVDSVGWNDIQKFLSKLNEETGLIYRLPTEAEWEYAARGGNKEKWAGTSNEDELGEYAWYEDNSIDRTHPVGTKKPNGLGLCDMSGNVVEWCSDWYDKNYYENSPENNPKGPSSGEYCRVFRGGSWNDEEEDIRTSNRIECDYLGADYYNTIGFRLAISNVDHSKLQKFKVDHKAYQTELEKAVKLYGKGGDSGKPLSYIENKFEVKQVDGVKVVIDHATDLMWQQSGTDGVKNYSEAKKYISQLNLKDFAGYSNWRLPTLEEAMTLMELTEKNGDLNTDPVFNKTPLIWTSDLFGAYGACAVYFSDSQFIDEEIFFLSGSYVRAVR